MTIEKESNQKALTANSSRISYSGWYMLGLPWSVVVLAAVLNFSLGVILPSMRTEIGFSTTQAGYLSSVSWFITLVLMFPMAGFVNRFGAKKTLSIIYIMMGLMVIVQAASKSYETILVARMLGLGFSVGVMPSISLLKQKWIPISRITEINGFESLMNPIGQIIALSIIPLVLTHQNSWRAVFFFLGIVISLVGLLWTITGKESPKQDQEEQEEESLSSANRKSLFSALRHKEVWLNCLAVMGTSVVWIAYFTFWPTYATENLHLSLTTAGLLLSVLPVGSVVASLVMPRLANLAGVEKPFIWVWGLLLPGLYYSMLISPNPIIIALGAFGAGFGAFAFTPFSMSLFYKIKKIKPEEIVVSTGMMMVFVGIGSGLGPIISSQLFQSTGNLHTALKICCLFPITLAIFGIFLPERGRIAMEKEG